LNLLNVGWLDAGNAVPGESETDHAYCTGPTTLEFQDALGKLCERPQFLHRGVHLCGFCRRLLRDMAGNGQIRVPGQQGLWYAAPALVHHYVLCHGYLPPKAFMEAVLASAARPEYRG
jgi:hypothetical protein